MATQYPNVHAQALADRAEALGYVLFTDTSLEEGQISRPYHLADLASRKILCLMAPTEEIEEFLTRREHLARTNEKTLIQETAASELLGEAGSSASKSLASVIDAKLIELEHECDLMTQGEVYSQYRGYGWDVFERRTGEIGVFTTANNGWSDKGVRHFLALLELEEFAFSDDGGGIERREPVMSLRGSRTAEIDPDLEH